MSVSKFQFYSSVFNFYRREGKFLRFFLKNREKIIINVISGKFDLLSYRSLDYHSSNIYVVKCFLFSSILILKEGRDLLCMRFS